jgi:hypothetical protein
LKREPSQHALLRPRTANVVGFVIAATVGVIFLVTTIALTYHSWQRMLKQREVAVRFVAVPATILSSEVVTRRSKSSKTYRNQIRYSYTVDGKTYTSDQIAFDYASGGQEEAKQIEAQFQPGVQVTAYVDSADPGSATLWKGSRESSVRSFWMIVVFLMPFQAFSLAMVAAIANMIRPGGRSHDVESAGGFLVRQDEQMAVLRLTRFEPLCKGLVATGIAAFVSVFVLAFATRMQPPAPVSMVVAGACAVFGVVFYLVMRFRRDSGHYDLVIDRQHRLLILPRSKVKQGVEASVGFDEVTGLTRTSTRGNRGGTFYSVRLTVGRSPDSRRYQLASALEAVQARALAEFLAREVGLREDDEEE